MKKMIIMLAVVGAVQIAGAKSIKVRSKIVINKKVFVVRAPQKFTDAFIKTIHEDLKQYLIKRKALHHYVSEVYAQRGDRGLKLFKMRGRSGSAGMLRVSFRWRKSRKGKNYWTNMQEGFEHELEKKARKKIKEDKKNEAK